MKTKTQQLAQRIQQILKDKKSEIKATPTHGPRGGTRNARTIPGWENCGNSTITRAANIAGAPSKSYWSGSAPTPSTAFPSCIIAAMYAAYHEIF